MRLPLLATLLLACATPAAAPASARSGVSVDVIVDGRVLTEHRHGGRTYVEAKKGREYSIRLRNDTGARVAIALAVDGLNSIDAKHTSASEAAKWVVEPWSEVSIAGWQVDSRTARRFVFTTEDKSYGDWLGDTRNLGVISAAVFREKPRPEPYCCDGDAGSLGDERESSSRYRKSQDAPSSSSDASGARAESAQAPRSAPREEAATGIGRRASHDVEWVSMELESSPIATVDIRYGYRDELVALGVLPEPQPEYSLQRREDARGFSPDPGVSCCR